MGGVGKGGEKPHAVGVVVSTKGSILLEHTAKHTEYLSVIHPMTEVWAAIHVLLLPMAEGWHGCAHWPAFWVGLYEDEQDPVANSDKALGKNAPSKDSSM